MSTSMLMNPDDPTVFAYISDEELARPFQPSMTEEEFTAFFLSVSPHTTEFNLPDDSSFPFDTNATIDEIIAFPDQNPSSDITITDQPSLNPDYVSSGNMTPQDFIVDCGMDPADFKSLQNPAPSGDSDTWNFVLHEMLDKMTEWAKTTNLSLRELGVSVEELQNFGLLDDVQSSI
ncbi:hypothetical protein C0989_011158 [Termitomyces sp. Mn162]|nr:hypothetical protein C0989_011158 [Termitomyces sp. Mn162]